MHVVAIIAAGGRGHRLGAAVPKQLVELGGRSLLQRSIDAFAASGRVAEIVAVVPDDLLDEMRERLHAAATPLRVVAGGVRRQDSVANGFEAVADRADLIVVHDAARPFVSPALIARTLDAAQEAGAAVAALASRDTVKRATPGAGPPLVAATLPRETIYFAQTPQAFRRDVLRDAIALGRSGVEATDEAALAERAGHPVRLVDGDPRNIKITTDEDLALARRLVDPGETVDARVGTGYDLHRLVEGRPLVLGGVTVPFSKGLAGHSDADALCHAVTDAILGAANAGDIGRHFPDGDARWKDASSLDLLRRAAAIIREAGFTVASVDAVVIAEKPRLVRHTAAMTRNLADAIGIEPARVSVKGKTNEGVGELGRGEAIAVHAVAMVVKQQAGSGKREA